MAGIGVKLNRIYQKNTITPPPAGPPPRPPPTTAPALVAIINLLLMQNLILFVILIVNCFPVRCFMFLFSLCLQLRHLMRYYPDICQMQSLKNGMKMCFHAIESVC